MPTFSSPAAFAAEVERMGRRIDREEGRKIATEAAEAAMPTAYRTAARDLGGDPKFSGWRPWLQLRTRNARNGILLTPTRTSAGPWTVAEFGRNTKAGPIVRQSSVGLSGRRKHAGRGTYRRWNGTTVGKRTASKAVEAIEKQTDPIVEKSFVKVVRKHFDVS